MFTFTIGIRGVINKGLLEIQSFTSPHHEEITQRINRYIQILSISNPPQTIFLECSAHDSSMRVSEVVFRLHDEEGNDVQPREIFRNNFAVQKLFQSWAFVGLLDMSAVHYRLQAYPFDRYVKQVFDQMDERSRFFVAEGHVFVNVSPVAHRYEELHGAVSLSFKKDGNVSITVPGCRTKASLSTWTNELIAHEIFRRLLDPFQGLSLENLTISDLDETKLN